VTAARGKAIGRSWPGSCCRGAPRSPPRASPGRASAQPANGCGQHAPPARRAGAAAPVRVADELTMAGKEMPACPGAPRGGRVP